MKNNYKVFFVLIGLMVLIKAIDMIFDPNKIFDGRTAVFSWIELAITLALGTAGIFFYNKLGFPVFLNKRFKTKKTIFTSIGLGLGFALLFVIYDSIARIGDISVGLPISILFYIWGAISSETIFRLFAIGLFTWIGALIFKNHKNKVYWTVAGILSFFAAFSMLSAFLNPDIPLNMPNPFLFGLLGILVISSELAAFKLLKKYGFLSSLIFRISFYSIWHIVWPYIFY
ncbi:MAG: hypothetical protein GY861_09265 [bacterium]|nr:hypothetical protein [bacterium]